MLYYGGEQIKNDDNYNLTDYHLTNLIYYILTDDNLLDVDYPKKLQIISFLDNRLDIHE